MSLYRTLVAAVAAMGLASVAFASTQSNQSNSMQGQGDNQTMQVADSSTMDSTSATTEQTKTNINTATAKELMKVKGLNAAKAKAIVTYRKKNGEFKSLDDLRQVKGFKKVNDKNLQEIQDQLTIS
jgi:competence protein ComEA